jgi:hypothetical protein
LRVVPKKYNVQIQSKKWVWLAFSAPRISSTFTITKIFAGGETFYSNRDPQKLIVFLNVVLYDPGANFLKEN